jgi:hypothetical protein
MGSVEEGELPPVRAWTEAAVRSLLPLPVALKTSPAARQLSLPPRPERTKALDAGMSGLTKRKFSALGGDFHYWKLRFHRVIDGIQTVYQAPEQAKNHFS